ncbi:hypothetical protein OS493_013884 [Desmophyllum pertusum]|uniref:Uncharacterized protein n=1 Tax=Desmophyllum pertusum TaxID=174260 RepID=A0A9W9ZQ39_9CNID|nr:hypothetical protein OS493_013884 [Desmophyllum pertusum]
MANEQRPSSPPPTYEEAINDDRPPPPYSENPQNPESLQTPPQAEYHAPSQRNSRVSPSVIVNQPGRRNDRLGATTREAPNENGVSQPRKKRLGCNCLCSAFQWTPCTCDCELFCFNCLGFLSYLLLCAPGVYLCWGCKKICPETCGDCCTRRTSMMESYEDRDDNIVARVCWFCVGPCCCFSCDDDTEVCPCSDPCVKRCGVCAVLKKMTCYCGSYKMCDYKLNMMDEQAVGFICDCKEVGCLCRDANTGN